MPVGYRTQRRQVQRHRSTSPRRIQARGDAVGDLDDGPRAAGHVPHGGWRSFSARDSGGRARGNAVSGASDGEAEEPTSDLGSPVSLPNNPTKGRAIENWLNHTLGQASARAPGDATARRAVAYSSAKQAQGLAQFGIDNAALEKLGMDKESAERVYRAMFVYSQGLHAVLQEATGKAKSSSQALLVLWRAFTAVLEHAGQGEKSGADSLAALVQRGNEEERERLEGVCNEKIDHAQAQVQRVVAQRRDLQERLQLLKDDEVRLRNEVEMYRTDHEDVLQKYEREIKLRTDAEVRFLDRTRWCEELQEGLDKERKKCKDLESRLKEEISQKEVALLELDALRTQLKVMEAQAAAYKQSVLEAGQQKQRHEQQVGQLKQQIERMTNRITELKDQLEAESEHGKRMLEQNTALQRDFRRIERQCEDESHLRKEIQSERDNLREKSERLDQEVSTLLDERRKIQKQLNDLILEHRTGQIDLKRKSELLERTEQSLERLQTVHRELVDAHRQMEVEVQNLRDDVGHLDQQVHKESDLRKHLQQDKKQLQGQMQNMQIQLDAARLAVQSTQKELQDVTETKVKLESIVRDTKSAMQKMSLEHQVELKAHVQKVSMLEKVISDERAERRQLVAETQEMSAKREEALETIKKKDLEIRELKRQRLEKEEESDRFKVLLRAQEQRNTEQLITVDKYHAAVASHDAEMRQMQVLLECERTEARRQLLELEEIYAAAKHTLQQRIECWKLSYEDALSQLNFNPLTAKLQQLEMDLRNLQKEYDIAVAELKEQRELVKWQKEEIRVRDVRIEELLLNVGNLEQHRDQLIVELAAVKVEYEHRGMRLGNVEYICQRMKQDNEEFYRLKAELEAEIERLRKEVADLYAIINKPKATTGVQVFVPMADGDMQTDLSYQYLEASEHLNATRARRERLDALKQASLFVEDPDAERDFKVNHTKKTMPVAELGTGEVIFDRHCAANLVYAASSSGRRGPGVPEPWPGASSAKVGPHRPAESGAGAGAGRRSGAAAAPEGGALLHVNRVKRTV